MKRTISIVLVILLVVTSTVLLVACYGGISNEEDWEKAFDAYKTCDKVTLKIEDNNKTINYVHDKERLISKVEISFDAQKGVVFISMNYSRRNFWEIETSGGTYEMYYVIEDTNVIFYRRYLGNYSQDWNHRTTTEFDSKEEAEEYLRDKYLHPVDIDEGEFPSIFDFAYKDITYKSFGKFESKTSDDRFNYTSTLNFSKNMPTKFTYQHKSATSSVDDSRKFTMTVKYTASISLPNDLPDTDRVE